MCTNDIVNKKQKYFKLIIFLLTSQAGDILTVLVILKSVDHYRLSRLLSL